MTAAAETRYTHDTYTVRRKIFKLLGDAFHVYGPSGEIIFYSKLKAFKLKEDIRLFTGEDMSTELMAIKARKVLDISSAYDVVDTLTGERIGALRRKGLRSMMRDTWLILDANEREFGTIEEDNLALALVRRFITDLVPQSFEARVGGTLVCTYRNNLNPFVRKVTAEILPAANGLIDRRLALAAAILLCAIEGKQ